MIHFVNNEYVNVWLGKKDGTFDVVPSFYPRKGTGYAVGSNNYRYEYGDFNGDKKTNLIHFVSPT